MRAGVEKRSVLGWNKSFPRIRKEFLDEKILYTNGLSEKGTSYFVIILCCRFVTHPSPESGRTNGFHIMLRWRNVPISTPTRLVLVDLMDMVLNL